MWRYSSPEASTSNATNLRKTSPQILEKDNHYCFRSPDNKHKVCRSLTSPETLSMCSAKRKKQRKRKARSVRDSLLEPGCSLEHDLSRRESNERIRAPQPRRGPQMATLRNLFAGRVHRSSRVSRISCTRASRVTCAASSTLADQNLSVCATSACLKTVLQFSNTYSTKVSRHVGPL